MISILTPTYNRAHLLPRVFGSLIKQTSKDFEWLIIDDGSTDSTEQIVNTFTTNDFKIHYFKKENGGKHTALNFGVKKAKGTHVLMLDSDDYLPTKAIETLINKINICPKNLGGVVGRKTDLENKLIGSEYPFEDITSNSLDIRYKQKVSGDLTEVFKREVMLEFPFPIFENERFCPEALVWNRIAQKYDLLFFNQGIYKADYQSNGLSSKIVKIRMNSPKASMIHYSELSSYKIPFKEKIKATINFWRFSFNDKDWGFKTKLHKVNKNYSYFCILIGFAMFLRDKSKL